MKNYIVTMKLLYGNKVEVVPSDRWPQFWVIFKEGRRKHPGTTWSSELQAWKQVERMERRGNISIPELK